MAKDHFTATIRITQTEGLPENSGRKATSEARDVREVSTIVIRADSIESLVKKAGAHLALVED